MKLIKGILGCALAAGLTTFAVNQAQAIIIDGELFSTLNVKLTVGVNDSKTGKITKHSLASKDALKALDFTAKGEMLAIQVGNDVDFGDVFVITKTSIVENLTADGNFTVTNDELITHNTENNNDTAETESTAGTLGLSFFSTPEFVDGVLNQADSEEASDVWFVGSGVYAYGEKDAFGNKDSESNKLQATFTGEGHDSAESEDDLPVTGTLTASGSGVFIE
jgi:hypothetical protein